MPVWITEPRVLDRCRRMIAILWQLDEANSCLNEQAQDFISQLAGPKYLQATPPRLSQGQIEGLMRMFDYVTARTATPQETSAVLNQLDQRLPASDPLMT